MAQIVYREHSETVVKPNVRKLAEDVKRQACRKLGLSPDIRLRWFDELDFFDEAERARGKSFKTFAWPTQLAGRSSKSEPDAIWLRASLKSGQAALVVSHELRHVWQWKHWPEPGKLWDIETEQSIRERDAKDFEWGFVSEWL